MQMFLLVNVFYVPHNTISDSILMVNLNIHFKYIVPGWFLYLLKGFTSENSTWLGRNSEAVEDFMCWAYYSNKLNAASAICQNYSFSN